jgi:hypothetical protein
MQAATDSWVTFAACTQAYLTGRELDLHATDESVHEVHVKPCLHVLEAWPVSCLPVINKKGHDSWHLSEQAKGGQEWNALYVSSNGAIHLLFHSQDWRAQKAVTAERFLCVTNVLEGPMGRSLKCLRAQVCCGSVHDQPSTDVKDEDQAIFA